MAENKGEECFREQGFGIRSKYVMLGASKRQWPGRVCVDSNRQLWEYLSGVLSAMAFIEVVKVNKNCIFMMDGVKVSEIKKVLSLSNIIAG